MLWQKIQVFNQHQLFCLPKPSCYCCSLLILDAKSFHGPGFKLKGQHLVDDQREPPVRVPPPPPALSREALVGDDNPGASL
jgi:hypothetical protein